jgi:hypothetical protein
MILLERGEHLVERNGKLANLVTGPAVSVTSATGVRARRARTSPPISAKPMTSRPPMISAALTSTRRSRSGRVESAHAT